MGGGETEQAALSNTRKDLAKEFGGFAATGTATGGREPHGESRFDPIGLDRDGAAFQYLLVSGIDGDASTLPAAGGGGDVFADGFSHLAGEKIAKCDLANPTLE